MPSLVTGGVQGYGDVVEAWSRWRGGADNDRRWMLWALLSLVLHVPFTPLIGVLGLVGWFLNSQDDIPEGPPITAIPIDLIEEEVAPEKPADASPAEPAAPAAVPEPTPEPGPKPRLPEPAPSATPPAPSASVAAPEKGAPISDPVTMSGGARKVVDPNANVRLIVDTEKLRGHPLGPRVGSLLSRVHQWRDFMGPAGLDPVRDIDRILIVGPQLRRTGDVVAVIQHRLGREAMRAAIGALVSRDPDGQWLEGAVPVARASADRAERYFVLPSERIVVVTPESALASARGMAKTARIPGLGGGQVATAYVATPHRAFIGLPLRVPKSIKWARARVTPVQGGGVRVDIEAEDESAELARNSASDLERGVVAATQLDLGVFGALLGARPQRFVDKVSFHAESNRIVGELQLTQKQLLSIFEFAEVLFVPPSTRSPRPRTTTTATPGVPVPTTPLPRPPEVVPPRPTTTPPSSTALPPSHNPATP